MSIPFVSNDLCTWSSRPCRLHEWPPAGSSERATQRTAAFTLVELLVVIAIIGILVALLLPTVQAAREAARRSQCQSQVKQLALGCLNAHDTARHFPTGGWGWGSVGDPDRGMGWDQPGGWIYNILPYIEEEALHDLGADGDPDLITAEQKAGAADVLDQPITIINCPTRRPTGRWPIEAGRTYHNAETRDPAVAGRSDYAMNSGTSYSEYSPGPSYTTDYSPAATYGQWVEDNVAKASQVLDGISFQRSEVSLRQVTDGTSSTLLIGEKFIPPSKYTNGEFEADNETWCTGWNNDNFRIVYAHLTRSGYQVNEPIGDTDSLSGVDHPEDRFGGSHPGVWIAAYCDGSVHAISYSADAEVLRRLASRHDGTPIDASEL